MNRNKKLWMFTFIVLFSLASLNTASFSGTSLKVVSVKPKGELKSIEEADQIVVTFNLPMVQLQRIEPVKPDWFIIEPAIDGEFQWLGTQTLSFSPRERFPYATSFKITIKSDVTSLSGERLEHDYDWTFQTPAPFLSYSYPQNNEKSVDTKIMIILNFNIPVLPSKLSQHLELFTYHDNKKISIESELNDGETKADYEMRIKPIQELEMAHQYFVVIKKGLPASEGNLGSQREWRLTFHTYGKFEFMGINQGKTETINPNKAITLDFTNPVEYENLVRHVSFQPAIQLQDYGYSYRSSSIHIYGPFLPDTTYEIHISKELSDVFGNKLEKDITATFQTRSYDPRFTIPRGESIIEAYGDHNIPVEMLNLNQLQLKVKVIPLDSVDIIGTWFSQSNKRLDRLNYRFLSISKQVKKNRLRLFPFNLREHLPDGEHGILLIEFSGVEGEELRQQNKRMLTQVTNLGITAKFSPVSNGIYVTKLRDGSPIAGVKIQIRDGTGKVYWTGETDVTGYCQSPGWQRLEMPASKNREPVQWAAAILGNDIAYTHSERGTGISPWEFNIPYEWRPRDEQLDGAIFTDRGIYRAEDTVRVKIIMREKYGLEWRLTSEQQSFQVKIYDPTGKEAYNQMHPLNEFNAFDFEFPIPYDAKRGSYSIVVIIPQKLGYEGSIYESFWVEDYRPAEFEVTVQPQQSEYIFGDSLKASFSAIYLFGAPLKNAPIKWNITKSHYYHNPPGWDGYYFNPETYYHGTFGGIGSFSTYSLSDEGSLDAAGTFSIAHFLDEPNLLTSAQYMIEGVVTDQNRREIAGRKSVTVFRGEYQVGVKPKSFFGEINKTYPIDIITASRDGKLIRQRKVQLHIVRRNWYSVRKAGFGGRYQWETQVTDSTIVQTDFVTGTEAVSYNFTPALSGYYLMRATSIDDRGNQIMADCSFYILGKDYVAWMRTDDDRIELEKDRQKYKPGDMATILVKSPFEKATALVTIEREGIIDHFTKEVVGSTPTIEIPIRDIYLPNVYVSVMLIQGRIGDNMFSESGEDIGKPAFKLGYMELPVGTGRKRLTVNLTTNQVSYKPGEEITIHIKASDWQGNGERSEVVLAVVDKGVLNLIGYRFTNLHDYFYRSRSLFVTTSESRLNIIGQRNYGEKGENRGGAGGMAMALFEMRKEFKTTPYWNPSLITDEQGNATVRFRLPDNLTTFVIMAAVHNQASEFGNGEQSFKVSKPLVLKPALPRFIRYQDVFKAGTVVHNYSDYPGTVTVEVIPEGVQLLDPTNKMSVNLSAGESKEVRFLFKANQTGKAEFAFRGILGGETDGVIKTIPIHQPLTYEVVATANNATKTKAEKIIVPQNCYSEMSTLEVKTASTQLIGISDGISYLFDYTYGCLEQKLSRILPMVLFSDVVDAFKIPALKDADYRREVQKFFDQLSDFQTPTGGFTFWQNHDIPNPYVSAWAVFAMIKGKEADYKINKESMEKAVKYLQNVLHNEISRDLYPYTWNYWSVTNCLILYDLTLRGKPDHAYIEKLFQERERVPLFGLTYLLKAMKYATSDATMYQAIKDILLNGLKDAPTSAHFEEADETGLEWCFHSNVRTTALILQSLLELKEDFPQAPKVVKWLLLKRNQRGVWRSTQENIYVLQALNTYFKVYEKEEPDFKLKVKLANQKIFEELYQGYTFSQRIEKINLSAYRPGKELELEFDQKGEGRFYYETRLKYYPQDPLPAIDQGISIIKKWEVVEGEQKEDGSIGAGSVVKVTLTIATAMERNYVVVDDPLSAGLEVINTRLKTVSESYQKYKPLELHSHYWGGFNFYELRDDKVLVFADNLPAGVHTFVYLCHALTAGDFSLPAAKAEEMYTPEVFGRTKDEEIVIR